MKFSLRVPEDSACRYRRISGGGIRIIWELTSRCNLRCKHCFANVSPKTLISQMELKTEEALKIIDQFNDIQVAKVMLTGGEVFVRDDIMTIIRAIRNKNRNIIIDITTNALLLNSDLILSLKQMKVNEMSISLDGTKEIYQLVRGKKADYEALMRNIKNLIDEGILVDGIMVLNRITHTGIDETVELAANLGLSSFTIANLEQLPHSNFDYKSLHLTQQEIKSCLLNIESLKIKFKERMIVRTTGFSNCSGAGLCTNDTIMAIDRNGMYCHCLNVYGTDDMRIDSRKISLADAFKTLNFGVLKG